jgi:hypothetical protein
VEHARSFPEKPFQELPEPTAGVASILDGACITCGGGELEHLIHLGSSPATTGALHNDAAGARTVRCGEIDLVACRRCGHVANRAFDVALVDYDASYDNSLHFSPTFQAYAESLAERLAATYDLARKHILEIGSGRGDFLTTITRRAAASGTGYDPTYMPEGERPGITLVPDYFRPEESRQHYDLLVCRHVLEHLAAPQAMLAGIRATAPATAVYYFEVPAAEFCFGPAGMWDCIYPHVSYFCRASLRHLLQTSGFELLADGMAFDGQYLWVEARPTGDPATAPDAREVEEHLARLRAFADRWEQSVTTWRRQIDQPSETSSGVRVLWGAGAKAVAFLNAVDPRARLVVVDLNPRKWGRYLPRTAHLVRSPDSLAAESVAEVLITNPVYRTEIAEHLERIGISAPIVAV